MNIIRLPNGYGSIIKLSGNRRNPWCVRKTAGWSEDKKQQYIYIGYYRTRAEAMKALAAYNCNPDSVEPCATFAEIYDKWSESKFPKISRSNAVSYGSAYKAAASLHAMKFSDIKKAHLQSVIDKSANGHSSLSKIKVLFNQLFNYAIENDIVEKDYSRFVEIGTNNKKTNRRPFNKDEIAALWSNVDMPYVDTILIMLYSGMRPGELTTIRTDAVNLSERTMRGGIKTSAGKDRVIPINKKIAEIVSKRVAEGYDYLVANSDGSAMSYYDYYTCNFKPIMEHLGMDHRPHDCRHTFATLMDNAGANKLSIKRIMGHASKDVTDSIYTHKDIGELIKAIDMI